MINAMYVLPWPLRLVEQNEERRALVSTMLHRWPEDSFQGISNFQVFIQQPWLILALKDSAEETRTRDTCQKMFILCDQRVFQLDLVSLTLGLMHFGNQGDQKRQASVKERSWSSCLFVVRFAACFREIHDQVFIHR